MDAGREIRSCTHTFTFPRAGRTCPRSRSSTVPPWRCVNAKVTGVTVSSPFHPSRSILTPDSDRPGRRRRNGQLEPVTGDACLHSMLKAEPPHDIFNLAWLTAHDLRTAVGENRKADPCLLAPAELKGDWSVPDCDSILLAHHRASHARPVADVEVDSAKCR